MGKIQAVSPQPSDGPPRAEVAPTTVSAPLLRTYPAPREWPSTDRARQREATRPASSGSFCICPADFTARGMCVCGRGREFARTNRASGQSFSSYRVPPTRDGDPDTDTTPRDTETETEGPESLSTEVKVRVEGSDVAEVSETDTLQSKKGQRRRRRAFFFTNDGVNVFLRAGMVGK